MKGSMMNKLPQVAIKCILDDVLKYEQPTKYIVKSTNYDDSYNTPVLTAGKSFIIGYTNETEGICNTLPVIIFDDFTTSSQYVDFPFKVKSSAMKILHATDEANIKYLYYLMQTIQHKADTHKRYWISEYSQREINLPSKPEQNKIVEKIEEEFGKIDEGVEKLKLAQEQIKQYRQSVLKSAFDGKIYKTTEWEEVYFKDIVHSYKNGLSKRNGNGNVSTVVLRLADIDGFNISLQNLRRINLTEKEIENYSIDYNDMLIIRVNGSEDIVGKFILYNLEAQFIYCDHLIRLKYNQDLILPKFLFYYAQTPVVRDYIKKNKVSTAGQNTVNQTVLNAMKIFLPTIKEQEQVIREIEKRFEVANEVERVITENLEKAEQLKQSILKKAFEGRLVPQDPTDQPASELLAQIQAERKK